MIISPLPSFLLSFFFFFWQLLHFSTKALSLVASCCCGSFSELWSCTLPLLLSFRGSNASLLLLVLVILVGNLNGLDSHLVLQQPLPLAIPRLDQLHTCKAAVVTGMEAVQVLNTTDFPFNKADLCTLITESQPANGGNQLASFPGENSQILGDTLITLDFFYHGRGSDLSQEEQIHISR